MRWNKIIMTIALFADEPASLNNVTDNLNEQGLDVRPFDLNSLRGLGSLGQEIGKGVLIFSKHGPVDATQSVRRLLTEGGRLILCAPKPDNRGYQLLKEMGASEIITPRSWEPEHVCERILAQLILDGDITPSSCGNIYGATRIMRDLYNDIKVIAPMDDPVLIVGETGTGKELVAKEVHKLSNRPDKLVTINCGELSLELAGSDLFGHKKGSFTGATEARQGLMAQAGPGTIFLDEIGELDLKAQAILLRAVEEKKVRRLGSNQMEDVQARIVLATNRDLEVECEEGRFRKDLFERIRGFTLELRPLCERRADIPLLVAHFLSGREQETNSVLHLPEGALDCLFDYEWPGNVRELRAAVRKAAAYADANGFISALHLFQATQRKRKQLNEPVPPGNPKHYVTFDPTKDKWKDFIKRAEAIYFPALMAVTGGNKKEACRLSGLSLSQLYEKLKSIK